MAINIELELTMTDDEMYDDIYKARKIFEKLLSNFEEEATKFDIEVEMIRMSSDTGEEIYNVVDGWEPNG